MESFLPSEIARLVLGYLEDQKCEEAYTTFLKTSIHLEECLKMKEDGRKFRTQVLGLSLLDILYEYSAIYSLVQERLKKVDPEAVERLRHSGTLLDKITFLLNSTSSGQTMLFSISLPPGNSPQTSTVAHAHVRKRLRTSSSNDKRKDNSKKNFKSSDINESSIIEAGSNIHNLETTNLNSLPGNSNQNLNLTVGQQENEILRTPKRKSLGNNNNSNKRQSRANSVVPEDLEDNFDITALTQALLDNHELHEKIAENINKVICTPENNSNVSLGGQDACSAQNPTLSETNTTLPNSNNFTMELDNVIKKIVHDTESDPIFENFLHEVVGPAGQEETSDDYDDRGISNTSTPSKALIIPETVKKQNIKNRNRNGKLKRANSSENILPTIDDHNAVAIESIISINAPDDTTTTTQPIKPIENVPCTSTTVSTIISTKTLTDSSVIASENASNNLNLPITTVDTTNQNKGVLMQLAHPQQQQQQAPTFVIADSTFPTIYQQPTIMPDNRIIFLSNKTSTIGPQYLAMPQTFQISQPTTTTTTTAVISDDILSMPTVFISDDPKTSSGYIISQAGPKRPTTSRKQMNKIKTRTTPRQLKQKIDTSVTKELELSTTTQETETVKYTISIQAEPKQTTDNKNEEPVVPSTSGLTASNKKDTIITETSTPEKAKTTSTSKLQLSLSSPRSNKSHIRALDFSTPPKEDQSPRKSISPPKSHQKKANKSPKTGVKKRSTFVSPVKSTKLPIATKSPKVKLKGDWNADLIGSVKNKKSPKLRRSGGSEKETPSTSESKEGDYKVCECTGTKPVAKKFNSWDHELRSLIVPVPSTSAQPKKTPAKKRTRISQRNKDAKDKKANLSNTETEVKSIEAELAKMEEDGPEIQPTVNTTTEDPKEKDVQVVKVEKKKKQTIKTKTIVQKVLNTPEKTKETEKLDDSNNTSNQELNKSITTESLRNMTPKIRKKCNTSNTKKTPSNSDEKKPKPTENKANNESAELKNTSNDTQTEKEFVAPSIEVNKSLTSILTPNMLKPSCSNEVTAKRNLIPVLETPMKHDSLLLPITPRLFTPFNLDSPLTRLLGEKMDTGDLAPFLSPSFPMTPSFPITPNLQSGDTQSSYASRPTDYSNSSSYYQPSDSEQNQKLEQVLIDEAMKIETSDLRTKHLKTSTPFKTNESTPDSTVTSSETNVVTSSSESVVANSETGVTAKVQLSGSLLEQLDVSKKSIEISQLSLDSSTATASSSNINSSSTSGDDTKENIENKEDTNITVIHAVSKTSNTETNKTELRVTLIPLEKKDIPPVIRDNTRDNTTPKEPIKRPRGRPKSPLKRLNAKRPPGRPRKCTAQVTTKKEDGEEVIEKHRELKSNVTGSHVMLLKELEEKRKRIVTGLNSTKPVTTKPGKSIGPRRKNIKETIKERSKHTTKEQLTDTTKECAKKPIKDNLRVTRASVNKTDPKTKAKSKKTISGKLSEPPFIPRKLKSPHKTSTEKVTVKLLKDKKSADKNCETVATTNPEINQSFSSSIFSVGSPNVNISILSHDDGLISYTPDEELPRLHISSDEEHIEDVLNKSKTNEDKIDNSDLLVKELKERGIYLIPNKDKKVEKIVKEKQNDDEEQKNHLQKDDNKEKNTEQLQNKEKSDKIEIISDINLDKSKVIDVSKIELSHSVVVTDVISRTTIKNKEPILENIATIKDASKDTVNTSESTLDVSENSDYDFHVKVVNESSPEFINYTYDESKKTEKNLSYYNFTVLKRNISAKIYIEEFDKWEDKTFTVTPYIDIYTKAPKRKPTNNKTESSTAKMIKAPAPPDSNKHKKVQKPNPPNETIIKAAETQTNFKPLEILFNDCIDESSTDTIITIKDFADPRTKLVKPSNSSSKIDKKEPQITKDVTTSTSKGTVKRTISLEQYKMNKNKDNANNIKTAQKTKDEVVMESVEIIDTSIDEDLNSKKRKATEETLKQNAEKRIKPDKHALLKSLDVDSFLTQLYGSSEKS